ncbi:MAG: hypothetical protein WCZ89_00430 [Phycisphaerae bacterium]
MKLENRKPSGREKDEAAVQLLAQLRERLHCDNSSVARRAAFNLSWMQEDGLEILQEGLLRGFSHRTKSAAAYGLRNMHGRMKKLSVAVLKEGSKDSHSLTREVCIGALDLLNKPRAERIKMGRQKSSKFRIREIKGGRRPGQRSFRNGQGRTFPPGRSTVRH